MTQTDDQATGEAEPFFRRGNYAPVPDEISADELPVDGAIPTELHGWYLRNGPNPRRPTDHWFVGDGMIHGVHLEGGRARWYRNRWVRTDSFDNDFPVYNPDGTRNLRSSVANTHVINHAGRTLALVESSLPYEITTELKTVGAYDFNGRLTDSMTAHPKICPVTGELHFFGYGSLFKPHVTYLRADANGELTINRPVDVPALTMMHDFALTAGHVLFRRGKPAPLRPCTEQSERAGRHSSDVQLQRRPFPRERPLGLPRGPAAELLERTVVLDEVPVAAIGEGGRAVAGGLRQGSRSYPHETVGIRVRERLE